MNDVLRIVTTGNVDDGKSTLIGRLLYETKSLPADKLEDVQRASKRRGFDSLDFSLFTDGLLAEREQGITIDVAHVYFQSSHRKFIVADSPGHVQYTRNMVTGASTSSVALILIDARNGSLLQTYRHFFISLSTIIVCINKMDMVGYEEHRFFSIVRELSAYADSIGFPSANLIFIPISASLGDNVTTLSGNTPWYKNKPLLELLETLELPSKLVGCPFRFQVQYILRSQRPEYHDYRGYAGKIASGTLSVGDAVTVFPARVTTAVAGINLSGKPVTSAQAGESISIQLVDDIDISRDMIVKDNKQPTLARTFGARLCWLHEHHAKIHSRYLLQHGVHRLLARLDDVVSVIHPGLQQLEQDSETLALNDIGDVIITAAQELQYDLYEVNKANGAFILIDEKTNDTVAIGIFTRIHQMSDK